MFDVISAGHLCVDISPKFSEHSGSIQDIFTPGKLTNVGELVFATGGASVNVGLALEKLGTNTVMVGKTGTDEIGDVIHHLLEEQQVNTEYIIRKEDEFSSYSIVIAPQGVDRIFLHYPGANDTFTHEDLDLTLLQNAKLFHFGYPPLMKQFYTNDGEALEEMMKKAKETGVTTSLDMSLPDPSSPSGKADWKTILARTLKYVDIFVPSVEELVYMLDREKYEQLKRLDQDILKNLDRDYLSELSEKILAMGCKINVIKCGKFGYYLRTADEKTMSQLGRAMPCDLKEWGSKEIFSTIYHVEEVVSATGAGDCSIAGFIAALLAGYSPEMAINIACAAGATAVTTYGATDGMVPMEVLLDKIEHGWEKNRYDSEPGNWEYDEKQNIYYKKDKE